MTESKIIKSIVYVNLICLNVPYPPVHPFLKTKDTNKFLGFSNITKKWVKNIVSLVFLG